MWPSASCAFAAAAGAVLAASPALACSCAFPQSPAQHLGYAEVVFKGRVVSSSGDISRTVSTFRVEDVLKGTAAKEQPVEHTVLGAACGVTFKADQTTHLVFAYRADGKLWTNACTAARFSEAEYRAALDRRK